MSFTYQHPHPAVAVDGVVFGFDDADLKLLLIQRKVDPFKGKWALPGGFVDMEEQAIDAAKRELQEETGLTDVPLKFLSYFDGVHRDPRERTLSLAFCGVVEKRLKVRAGDDAAGAKWRPLAALPELAFDHDIILKAAIKRFGRAIGV